MLRGLFIGIDRYPAPINRLTCAHADAVALGALFTDNGDGQVDVLTDAEATRDNIVNGLRALQSAATDDLVVIGFSGHGTEDHRLVPVGADIDYLAASCISLDCGRSQRSQHQGSEPARSPLPRMSTSRSRRNRIDRVARPPRSRSATGAYAKQFAGHAHVIFLPDVLEPDFLQDTSTGGVFHGYVRIQGTSCGIGQVPRHQGCGDLGRQALTPSVPTNGVAQLPAVPERSESGPTDEMIIVVSQAPFRETSGGVLGDVLVDETRSLCTRLGPTLTDEPHSLCVRMHDEQIVHVAGKPGRRHQSLGLQYALT